MYAINDELCHHGILGMKWGVRRFQNRDGTRTNAGKQAKMKYKDAKKDSYNKRNEKIKNEYQAAINKLKSMPYNKDGKEVNRSMTPDKRDSSVTRKVKNDYNNLSDAQFKRRHQVSKKTYAKRVQKYGDPYMYSPLAKMGKNLAKSNRSRKMYTKRFNKMDRVNAKNSRILLDELETLVINETEALLEK